MFFLTLASFLVLNAAGYTKITFNIKIYQPRQATVPVLRWKWPPLKFVVQVCSGSRRLWSPRVPFPVAAHLRFHRLLLHCPNTFVVKILLHMLMFKFAKINIWLLINEIYVICKLFITKFHWNCSSIKNYLRLFLFI